MNAQAYDQYKRTSVETLTPAKLLLMLFEGLLKNLRTGEKAINQQNMNLAHNQLVKAQDIITELMATLNMDYELSGNLLALYDYMHQRLVLANTAKDSAIIQEVYEFAAELRTTFAQAADLAGRDARREPVREYSFKG